MSNHEIFTSPRGFIITHNDPTTGEWFKLPYSTDQRIQVVGRANDDVEISRIWKSYRGQVSRNVSIETLLAITRRFIELVPEIDTWVYYNLTGNPLISRHGIEFIQDCIQFATTGERRFPITTWYELIEPSLAPEPTRTEDLAIYRGLTIVTTEELLTAWCSQKDGVNDLLMSAHLLFCSGKGG